MHVCPIAFAWGLNALSLSFKAGFFRLYAMSLPLPCTYPIKGPAFRTKMFQDIPFYREMFKFAYWNNRTIMQSQNFQFKGGIKAVYCVTMPQSIKWRLETQNLFAFDSELRSDSEDKHGSIKSIVEVTYLFGALQLSRRSNLRITDLNAGQRGR